MYYLGLLWSLRAFSPSVRASPVAWSAAPTRAGLCGLGVRLLPVSSPRRLACSSPLAGKGRLGLSPSVPLLLVGARWFVVARVAPVGLRVPWLRSVRPGRSRCGFLLACPPAPLGRSSAPAGCGLPGSRHVSPPPSRRPPCPPLPPPAVLVAGGGGRPPVRSPLAVGFALVRSALALVSGPALASGACAPRVVAVASACSAGPRSLAPLVAVGSPACPVVAVPLSARLGPGGSAAPHGPARALAVFLGWFLARGARVRPCRGCAVVAPVVMVCGSRILPSSAVPLVGSAVSALLSAGSVLAVGCSAGADAAAVSSVVAAGAAPRLQVWAAFGPVSPPWRAARYSAPGACSSSSVPVVASALLAGAAVRWWAGGPASVPLRARLVRRSLACVQSAASGGPGSGVVAFVSQLPPRAFGPGAWPSCGSGSWGSVGAASLLGLPVLLVPVGALAGVSLSSLPALPGGGSWSPVSAGVLAGGFRWSR
jgi:hypothetical protein